MKVDENPILVNMIGGLVALILMKFEFSIFSIEF
jgi:hypothetical protein